jgi:hypothetical protein
MTSDIGIMTDDELRSDRTIRILTPSSHLSARFSLKRSTSQEFLINGAQNDDERTKQPIIITSTCLDDDQMVR